jgi:hypothetical protein
MEKRVDVVVQRRRHMNHSRAKEETMKVKIISNPKCRAYAVLMDDEADRLHRAIFDDFRTRGIKRPRSTSYTSTVFKDGEFAHQHNFSLVEEVCDEYETRMGMTTPTAEPPALQAVAVELGEIAANPDEQEPDGWLDIATAPEKEDGDWFIGRVAPQHRAAAGKDSIVIQRRTWQHCPWRSQIDGSYAFDFFDAWKPLVTPYVAPSWIGDLLRGASRAEDEEATRSATATGEAK